MRNYSRSFKLEVVKYYLENKDIGYLKTAKYFNLPSEVTVLNWVKKYQEHGEKGLMKNPSSSYSGKFKRDVLKYMHTNQLSYLETATHFNIGASTVKDWEFIYFEKGTRALNTRKKYKKSVKKRNMIPKPRKINKKKLKEKSQDELIAKIEQLEMENAYLKKLQALVQQRNNPPQEKK